MEYGYDTFRTELPEDQLEMLLDLGAEMDLYIDPTASLECEQYFSGLLSDYRGDREGLRAYCREAIRRDFRVMKEKPAWLQGDEWQFHNGRPMAFVGQLDAVLRRDGSPCGISFYVFYDLEDGAVKTVTQCD